MPAILVQVLAGLVIGGLAGVAWIRSLRRVVGAVLGGRSMMLALSAQAGRFLALALLFGASLEWLGPAGLIATLAMLTLSTRLVIGLDGRQA